MKVTRIYTGGDGKTHFEDLEVPLKDGGHIGKLSALPTGAQPGGERRARALIVHHQRGRESVGRQHRRFSAHLETIAGILGA